MNLDLKIIEMRKGNSRLYSILLYLQKFEPFCFLDNQIILAHILNVLDKNNLAVSRNEVRTCFNRSFNFNFHGDKVSYLSWMYKAFHIKQGNVIKTKNVRLTPSKNTPLSQTVDTKDGFSVGFLQTNEKICTKPHLNEIEGENSQSEQEMEE